MENKKIFTDAIKKSRFNFGVLSIFFLFFPVCVIYIFIKTLRYSDFRILILLSLLAGSIVIYIYSLVYLSKHFVLKIITDNTGISFFGVFKKVNASWNDVLSVESTTIGYFLAETKVAKVTTKNGNFYFPFTMKEQTKEYPKLKLKFISNQWLEEDGIMKDITFKNCPLHIEIQRYLGNK